MLQDDRRYLEFVYLELFERTRKGVLTDDEMRAVEIGLLANPVAGPVVRDTGGVRKLRAAQTGRGKSGSARVTYLYLADEETIYFIFAFATNVQGNLTHAQKKQMREMVAVIRSEEWPRRQRRK